MIVTPHVGIGPLRFGMTEADVEAILGHCTAMEVFFDVRAWCSYKGSVRQVVFDFDFGAVHFEVVPPGPAELMGTDLFSLDSHELERFVQSESLNSQRVYYDEYGRPGTQPSSHVEEPDEFFELQLIDLDLRLTIDRDIGLERLQVRSPRSERDFSDFSKKP